MPELHLWHRGYSTVSSSPCNWSHRLLAALMASCSLLQLFVDFRKTRWLLEAFQTLYWILHFQERTHRTTGPEWQCVYFDTSLLGSWDLHQCQWRGQGQPVLFLLVGWKLPAHARNKVSHSIKHGFLYLCACVFVYVCDKTYVNSL